MSERILKIEPDGFPEPRGYANGILSKGRALHIAGQIGWQADGSFASEEFVDQFARALDNVLAVVTAAGGEPSDVVEMTVYVTDLDAYRSSASRLGPVWQKRFGKHFPAMALVGVTGLVHPQAKVEIQAHASLQDR